MKATHSTALATTPKGELPEWIQLLPGGTFSGVDGRGPYSVPDPEAVMRLTRERTGGNDIPIDYGHALELEGYSGDAAPAAGWISDFEVRDGEMWGRVAWTEDGAVKIRGREFRFLSPVFYHNKDGVIQWIIRAGLTNRPNLALRAVHSTQRARAAEDPESAKIFHLLGMADPMDTSAHSTQPTRALTAQERAICATMGISEHDFRKNLDS